MVESVGSGRSPNVIVTAFGEVARLAPGLGSDDCGSACATAGAAVRSVAASATPAATLPVANRTGLLGPGCRATPHHQKEGGGAQDHAEATDGHRHDQAVDAESRASDAAA